MSDIFRLIFWASLAVTFCALTFLGLAISWLVVPQPLQYYRTTYFEFGLPAGWWCDREGTETTCFPSSGPPYSGIIIFTAKYRGDIDERRQYEEHLKAPRVRRDKDGTEHRSEVVYVKRSKIAGYEWVDGLHLGSEVRNYYTRYLASLTSHLGVLITVSIHKDHYKDLNKELGAVVEGLRIYQSPNAFN